MNVSPEPGSGPVAAADVVRQLAQSSQELPVTAGLALPSPAATLPYPRPRLCRTEPGKRRGLGTSRWSPPATSTRNLWVRDGRHGRIASA